MYFNHLTLTTGHNARTSRADVSDETLALVAPWLDGIINSGALHPLPVQELSHLAARASVEAGSLIITVFAPAGPFVPGAVSRGKDMLLVTFGVAQRSRQGAALWPMLVDRLGAAPDLQRPAEPWLAVALHEGLIMHMDVIGLLGDFERCCAWAWMTRNPSLEAAT
jgi:hypothetical protein